MQSTLSPLVISGIIAAYFAVLILISFLTSRKERGNASFFLAGRKSPWPLVAIGMIGASLSGVTFISVPGAVGALDADGLPKVNHAFSYMQVVLGYLFGYLFIATVLLPLYYRLGLTSIYEYLRDRIGFYGYKIGAFYFLLSRVIGAAFRLFLVAIVLQEFVTGPLGVPFAATVAITILLIWLYTFRGGIQTIVYTDTLQTVCMLLAAGLTVYHLTGAMEATLGELPTLIRNSEYGQVFFFENGWSDPNNFWKQFFSGALITIVMTGLDQDMMQKNLSMPTARDAQKNMAAFSFVLIFANLLFLTLGALLYLYAKKHGLEIPAKSDQLYPTVALRYLPAATGVGVLFVLGLIAAAYSSADSALAALTTSFCVDFLGMEDKTAEAATGQETATTYSGGAAGAEVKTKSTDTTTRTYVHIGFSLLLFLVILLFRLIDNPTVINNLFKAAGYTYGPLLGLFAFGLFTRLRVRETIPVGNVDFPVIVLVCLLSPAISFVVDVYSAELLGGFSFGFLILAFNGLLTFLGLLLLSDFSELDQKSK